MVCKRDTQFKDPDRLAYSKAQFKNIFNGYNDFKPFGDNTSIDSYDYNKPVYSNKQQTVHHKYSIRYAAFHTKFPKIFISKIETIPELQIPTAYNIDDYTNIYKLCKLYKFFADEHSMQIFAMLFAKIHETNVTDPFLNNE